MDPAQQSRQPAMLPDELGRADGPAAVCHYCLTMELPVLLLSVAEVLTVELEGRAREEGSVR